MKRLRRRKGFTPVVLLVLWFCLGTSALAQQYGLDGWTTADGLPQNTVSGIAQTPDGYLWLATFDGLARFDGVRFTVFDRSNSPGIVNNRFIKIYVGTEGAVWAATEDGGLTLYRDGVFTSYSAADGLGEPVMAIAAGDDGRTRIETTENYYYFENGKFVPAPDVKKKGERTIYFGPSGAKWIFTPAGATRLKDGVATEYRMSIPPESLRHTHFIAPFEDGGGALWLVDGVDWLKRRVFRLSDGAVKVFTGREIPELNDVGAIHFAEDHDGGVWMIIGNPSNKERSISFVRYRDGGIRGKWNFGETALVVDRFVDREGNIWLATYQGLRRFRRQFISTLSVPNGLLSDEVYSLLQTANGDVLIGSVGGVNRYSDGKIGDYGFSAYVGKGKEVVRGMWEDEARRLWISSFEGSGRIEDKSFKLLTEIQATDFAADSSGGMWLATEKGLLKFVGDREVVRFTTADGLPHDAVITIRLDRGGNLWIGTFDGLAVLEKGATRVRSFRDAENAPKGYVRYIHEDADGVLWFGTYGDGLVRYKDGKFFAYHVADGLFNNGVFAILEDDRENFWMSSNRGIHRAAKRDLNDFADGKIAKIASLSYGKSDGMLNIECNGGRMPAALKANDGKLWFPTMGGVVIVDPAAEPVESQPPPTIIEEVSVDRAAAVANPKSQIDLGSNQTSLAIRYTGQSLIKSTQIRFRYKLDGFEENWVDAGTSRTVNYSYLPAGNYTFRVVAASSAGVWNSEGAALKIVVHPVFYRTWWFLLLTAFAVALIVGFIYQNRVSQLRRIAAAKGEFSRRLIDSQEAERKRIASELHDVLGQSLAIISNRATMGKNRREDAESVVREFDAISSEALEALDEVQEITARLHPRYLERLGLTKAVTTMIAKVAEMIEVRSDIDEIDGLFAKDAEINIYRIIQESLNNIVKHSDAAEAVIAVKRFDDHVVVSIADDGRGFDPGDAKPTGSGLGLAGLRERTSMIGGTIAIDSNVGEGTEIRISLPVRLQEKKTP